MTDKDDILDQWWNALSAEQQAEALESQSTGRLTPQVQSSLLSTGMFGLTGQTKPERVPKELRDYLKMRH